MFKKIKIAIGFFCRILYYQIHVIEQCGIHGSILADIQNCYRRIQGFGSGLHLPANNMKYVFQFHFSKNTLIGYLINSAGEFTGKFSYHVSLHPFSPYIREAEGAGFSFYFESIYEPDIVVMVRAIFSITLFMGIAIFFLESSSGSIRIDWALERRGGGIEKNWDGARKLWD